VEKQKKLDRKKLIGVGILVLVAYAFGRYSVPERVEIKKEIVTVEVEKKETHKDQSVDQNKKKTEIELTRPDGTKYKKVITQTDKKTDTQIDQTVEREKEQTQRESTVIENPRRLNLSVLAGPNFTNFKEPLVYGGHVSRPFLGPITLGIWGLSNGTGGASIGLQF